MHVVCPHSFQNLQLLLYGLMKETRDTLKERGQVSATAGSIMGLLRPRAQRFSRVSCSLSVITSSNYSRDLVQLSSASSASATGAAAPVAATNSRLVQLV